MKTLIRNATVVLPEGCCRTSVLIDGARIGDIDPAVQLAVDESVDASGLYLLPGVIDDQVHFRQPGLTHKEDLRHASRACAKGGVTTFFEMPNTRPSTISCQLLADKLALASSLSLVNYGFYIGATPENLPELQQAERTPGIKVFIGSSTGELLVDDQEALERIFGQTTLPICAHCEDESTFQRNLARWGGTGRVADHSRVRDEAAAVIATQRAVELALRHRHRFHVLHMSTGAEIELVRHHHQLITAEVCPHHLFFNVDHYPRLGSRIQVNPSVKTAQDNRQLWQALLQGQIQVIATDHAPHTLEEKQRPYPQSPSGLPAVENALALLLNQVNLGRCALEQVVHWMCEAPARVWDVLNKGAIMRGYDADLVLVDLHKQAEIRDEHQETKCRWSPWHGTTLTGWPVRTWVLGQEVFREGRFDESHTGREVQFDHALGGYWQRRLS
ncbi:MAG: dihydroorotase [Pirellulaceae bacterium]|jgi:dihydroorotase|nr:dihydroorotase [Pirellulaceae bacterium]